MADIVDIAAEQSERVEAAQLAAVRAKAARREVQPSGQCHFCEADFDEPPGEHAQLYCDDFCRNKHQRQLQHARNH